MHIPSDVGGGRWRLCAEEGIVDGGYVPMCAGTVDDE